MERSGGSDDHRVIEAKRPNEVKLAEVKKPAEVLTMALKDSLKFGILIGIYFKYFKKYIFYYLSIRILDVWIFHMC